MKPPITSSEQLNRGKSGKSIGEKGSPGEHKCFFWGVCRLSDVDSGTFKLRALNGHLRKIGMGNNGTCRLYQESGEDTTLSISRMQCSNALKG